MKIKEFKSFIREEIIATLSEGDTLNFIASTSTSEEDAIRNNPKISGDTKTGALRTLKSLRPGSVIGVPTNEIEEDNNLTLLQQAVYEFESEVSPNPDEFIEDIKKLNSVKDVYDYYATKRGWLQDKDLKYSLKELLKYLVKKKLTTTAELKQLLLNEENNLNEMAVSYNLNVDKAQELKDIIDKAKEGNTKKVLNYLLDKEVIPSMKTVANDLGLPDSASFNTRAFRDFMLMLKDKGIVSMGGAAPKVAAVKPSKEKIEKAVKAVEKNIETGKEEVDDIEDREPTKAELEKEKIKGAPSKFKISQEQYEKLKKTLKTVVDKVQELDKKIKDPNSLTKDELKDLKDQKTRKIESLKQFIKNPELVKAFNERGVQIDTDDLVG
jgi:hypothetical protein